MGDDGSRHSASDRVERDKEEGFFSRLTGSMRREGATEEEICELVEDTPELADSEKRMIRDIIELGDAAVNEICTPRVDIMFVEDDESARVALERMRGTGYSRLPVGHDGIDEVVGLVNYKDLIGPLMDGSIDEPVTKFMYEPMFVPETKDVLPLLGEMQAAHTQMAIVVDEYGGTEGLVTIEDIVEEIVGEIADESDIGGELVVELAPGIWRADGRLPVEDAIELGWPVVPSDDYETLAGWLINELNSVPSTGEEIEVEDFTFKIEKMRRSRICMVRVEKTA